jgi:uncharacterized membrane protein
MALLDSAKEQAKQLAEKVTGSSAPEPTLQAITIGRPRHAVLALLRNPESLSHIFGEIADVHALATDRLQWTFHGQDKVAWECEITAADNAVRYVAANPDRPTELAITLRDAPQDKGTEIIATVSTPPPGLLTGPLTFKALYRARALLQTGEMPATTRIPSARNPEH